VITPKDISDANFKKYGKIVILPDVKPTSEDKTHKFWSDIAHYHIEGNTEIGLCTVYKQASAVLNSLERHANTPEILIPADASFVLPLQREDENHVEAFAVNPGEAVVIDKGIWHGPCIPRHTSECTYFVIFKHKTPHEDVQFKEIQPVEISI
jgi:ureidoglycolate lyase